MIHFLVRSIPYVLLFLVMVAIVVAALHDERKHLRLAGSWELVMEGTFDYVVYGEYDYVRREGSMSKRDVTYVMKTTAFHFADGRACTAQCRLDVHFPTGTHIRVLKNGLGEYRIEKT